MAQRDDDQEDIIEERLRVYEEMTQPLIEFYKEKEQQQASSSLSFIDFDVSKGRDATTPILMEIFHRLFPGFTVEDESRA